jgi:hypothetical protein
VQRVKKRGYWTEGTGQRVKGRGYCMGRGYRAEGKRKRVQGREQRV